MRGGIAVYLEIYLSHPFGVCVCVWHYNGAANAAIDDPSFRYTMRLSLSFGLSAPMPHTRVFHFFFLLFDIIIFEKIYIRRTTIIIFSDDGFIVHKLY